MALIIPLLGSTAQTVGKTLLGQLEGGTKTSDNQIPNQILWSHLQDSARSWDHKERRLKWVAGS